MLDLALHLRDHLALAAVALAGALALALPAGAALARSRRLRPLGLGAVSTLRVVPSLAVLAVMLPLVGIGFWPAAIALVLLAVPPIALNTEAGLRGVPFEVRDAARGLGMNEREVRARIEWPLALPLVVTGIRTATVEVIASATLAAFIGGGGLGEYIVNGLAGADMPTLLEGAISVAVLALLADAALGTLSRRLQAGRA